MKQTKAIALLLFISLALVLKAQDVPNEDAEPAFVTPSDTLEATVAIIKKRHSPLKAALLSAALPGAGQVYNKKYWKLPIVYGGLAGLGTWVGFNVKNLRGYTKAYKSVVAGGIGEYKGFSSQEQLRIKREDTKRSLDLSIILVTVFYAINIVDAAVDAHLFDYTITEDLSVSLAPDFRNYEVANTNRASIGLNIQLHFHNKKNY